VPPAGGPQTGEPLADERSGGEPSGGEAPGGERRPVTSRQSAAGPPAGRDQPADPL